jgi:2,4-dienoyl-CoA reductase (NADPH2)
MVQEMFIKAAERAYKAGFDGVEINSATCTLPNSFCSRVFNRRTDQYGAGSVENRARFVYEIIKGIKSKLPSEFAVIVITNIAEYNHPLATPIEEGIQIAKIFEAAGADALQIRGHYYGHRDGLMHPDRFFYPELMENPPKDLDWSNRGKGAILPYSVALKAAGVKVPIISAVRLDAIIGEKALEEGKIDFVGMTRRLLADPEYPQKVMENRLEDIRPCMGCLHCMDVRLQNKYVQCRVNPQINRETEITYDKASKKKMVMVVGAGPSGMEAARVAAIRGHEVHLYDKGTKLGGLLPLAAMLKDNEVNEMTDLVKWFGIQFKKLGVQVHFNINVTPETVSQLKPDVIVVAVGGLHSKPTIPGLENARVMGAGELHKKIKPFLRFFSPQMMEKLTRLYMPVGKNIVLIGGRIHGCETAEFLTKRGRKVTIVDSVDDLGGGMTGDDKALLFPWFDKKGVKQYLGVKYDKISDGQLQLTTREGKKMTLSADTIMAALPLAPSNGNRTQFQGLAAEVYDIGDCSEPRLIAEATAAGSLTAHKI